jgi:hypothetical protein
LADGLTDMERQLWPKRKHAVPSATCSRECNQSAISVQSVCNQRPSEAIRGHQRPSEAIRGHQRPSEDAPARESSRARG